MAIIKCHYAACRYPIAVNRAVYIANNWYCCRRCYLFETGQEGDKQLRLRIQMAAFTKPVNIPISGQ